MPSQGAARSALPMPPGTKSAPQAALNRLGLCPGRVSRAPPRCWRWRAADLTRLCARLPACLLSALCRTSDGLLAAILKIACEARGASFQKVDERVARLVHEFDVARHAPIIGRNFAVLRTTLQELGVISDDEQDDEDGPAPAGGGAASNGDDGGGSDGSSSDSGDGGDSAGRRLRRRPHAPVPPSGPPPTPGSEDDSVGVQPGLRAGGPSQTLTVRGDTWPPPPPIRATASERFCRPLVAVGGWAAGPISSCNCDSGQSVGLCITLGGDMGAFLDAELAKANDPAATLASNGYRSLHREPNNKQRKRCYRHVAIRVLAYTLREPLPHCVVTRIRIVWPSITGVYMGYKGC